LEFLLENGPHPLPNGFAVIAGGAGVARVSKGEFVKGRPFETAASPPPQGEGGVP
jgi:hypothetical protein